MDKTNTQPGAGLPKAPDLFAEATPSEPTEQKQQPGQPGEFGPHETTIEDVLKTGDASGISGPSIGPDAPVKPVSTPAGASGPGPGIGTKGTTLGKVLPGSLAVNLMDILLPGIIALIADKIGYRVDKKAFQLTQKEKEVISPAMTEYLESINVNFDNPLYNFLFVVAVVYGSKVIDVLPAVKKKEPEKPTVEKVNERLTKKEEVEKARMVFIKELRDLNNKEAAIQVIVDRKKMSRKAAADWYKKFVE